MKIETKYFGGIDRQSLQDFADAYDLTMEVHDRGGSDGPGRFYAHFHRCEVIGGCMLSGTYGDGANPEDAMRSYTRRIAGKRVAIDAWLETRREIEVPVGLFFDDGATVKP